MYSDRALVIGAGFAGLLAARVLSESYGDVVLVERDQIPADAGHRSGTPQAHHPHALLARGAEVLEALFPSLGAELRAAGAVQADLGSDFASRVPAGWAPRDPIGLTVPSTTRVTIERIIRRRVLKLANVSLVDGVTVDGLLHDRGTVTGVHGRRSGEPFTDYADLVVDASGRTSKLVSWLAELGVHCPAPMIVNGHLAYTSRLYHVNDDLPLDWKTTCEITHAPTTKRGGAVSTVDGQLWFVTLFGAGGDVAPTDDDGFLAYATTLECQDIAEIIKTATPASPIHRAANLRSRWNRFHKVPNWPRGLLALGDSVVSLNPVHGHGMTLAALNCAELRHLLQDHDLAKEPLVFQHAVAKAAQIPWMSATTTDLGWSQKKLPLTTRFLQWYARRLFEVIPGNPQVYRAFIRVSQMVDHPATLVRPAVLWRVLWRVLTGSRPQARQR
ncbi:FAD-dependent oxidoreductase [Lentzea nigeriaca]|uniref:FAD-dependent oxidoreductase n=1 Tax=Lentzea nigeriaca TaxID=1128665 RepID=UPI00195A7D59|nr:FAD-dependent monooxygenase [Lentzea nigeriaca]MBM7857383.1 2-polyprenyl-6-methoxyphenol hydroxylase-like FAD-dependent oxidoreductase [Lentzea nigeriaca]